MTKIIFKVLLHAADLVVLLLLGIMWGMEHDSSDIESDNDDDVEDKVGDEDVQSRMDGVDHSEPDWRQFAATFGGFQLDTTQESLTSNLFTAVKAEKEYVFSNIAGKTL